MFDICQRMALIFSWSGTFPLLSSHTIRPVICHSGDPLIRAHFTRAKYTTPNSHALTLLLPLKVGSHVLHVRSFIYVCACVYILSPCHLLV